MRAFRASSNAVSFNRDALADLDGVRAVVDLKPEEGALGFDHKKLTYKFQGWHHRLTDVHGEIVKGILA